MPAAGKLFGGAFKIKYMIMKSKQTSSRGRKQDRTKVAGGQEYEVRYESKKTGASSAEVKKAVKRSGNSRKNVESSLRGGK